jgi:hypothetical protein
MPAFTDIYTLVDMRREFNRAQSRIIQDEIVARAARFIEGRWEIDAEAIKPAVKKEESGIMRCLNDLWK